MGVAAPISDYTHREADDEPRVSRVYISTISKGPTVMGNSNQVIKSYARAYRRGNTEMMSVELAYYPPKTPKIESELIMFTKSDTVGVAFPHHNPLVIIIKIAH